MPVTVADGGQAGDRALGERSQAVGERSVENGQAHDHHKLGSAVVTPIHGESRLDAARVRRALEDSSLMIRFRWLVHAALLLMVASSLLGAGGTQSLTLPEAAAVVAFWIGLSTLYLRFQVRRVLTTLGADRGVIHYRFDENAFTMNAPASSVSMTYAQLRNYHEGHSTFLLHGSDRASYLVPKEAFSPPDALALGVILRERVRRERWERVSDAVHLALAVVGLLGGAWLLLQRLGR